MNSFKSQLQAWIQIKIKQLQSHIDQIWYGPLVGFLAAVDFFIIIVPTDGIAISSTLLRPRKWLSLAIFFTIGSTVGATLLVAFIQIYGDAWFLQMFPQLESSQTWIWTDQFFTKYGLWVVFAIGATPLLQHPSVILAALAEQKISEIAVFYLLGRLIKFLIMGYVASFMPQMLRRLWGVQSEMKDVGIQLPNSQN